MMKILLSIREAFKSGIVQGSQDDDRSLYNMIFFLSTQIFGKEQMRVVGPFPPSK